MSNGMSNKNRKNKNYSGIYDNFNIIHLKLQVSLGNKILSQIMPYKAIYPLRKLHIYLKWRNAKTTKKKYDNKILIPYHFSLIAVKCK